MPKIASYVNMVRQKVTPESLLLLDIGDHMDRMRIETEGTGGVVNVEILNETGYEAIVLGNNEGLTYTPADLVVCYKGRANFPVIGSNIIEITTGQTPDWMVPVHFVRKNDISIALIGVTAAFTEYYNLLGWQVSNPMQTVEAWVRKLRPEVDLLIVMSHLGLNEDRRMAEHIEGIDLILGGHTHHLLEQPLLIGETLVAAAGKLGYHVGEIEVEFDSRTRKIISMSGRVEDITNLRGDKRIQTIIDESLQTAEENLGGTIIKLNRPLALHWQRESELGNLLAAGLRQWTQAEIGLVNAGQLLSGLEAGAVSRAKMLQICPGPINPCRMVLTGSEILQALEESLLKDFSEKRIRGFGFRGEVLGVLSVDGLQIEYDPTAPDYNKIYLVQVQGAALEPEREYVVGTIDMFTFGVGYLSLQRGKHIEYLLPEFLRDVLAGSLCDDALREGSKEIRWRKRPTA
jgi:5'-nucleotidase